MSWTVDELRHLRRSARLMGPTFDLGRLALKVGRARADTNLALDALLGRSAEDAADWLSAAAPEAARGGVSRGLRSFLSEIFG